ncbi:isoprenoid synthase domain-containing protein [Aspergillus filifer]
MDKIGDYCNHSEGFEPFDYGPLPDEWFCLYPLRRSKYVKRAMEAGNEFFHTWNEAAVADGLLKEPRAHHACNTEWGNFASWCYPESLPDRMGLAAQYCDFAFFWDDINDVLDKRDSAEVVQDLIATATADLRPGAAPYKAKYKISQLGLKFARELVGRDWENGLGNLRGWSTYLDGQEDPAGSISYEELKKGREKDGAVHWGLEFGCWAAAIKATQEEKDSIADVVFPCGTMAVLVNDYYSFPKEFDELHEKGMLHRMKNAVFLLMRDYGYTEDEANSILKQEARKGEEKFIAAYNAWEDAPGPKSHELRRYWHMALFLFSGAIFWFAHAQRYNRTDLATTAEDRARWIGKCDGPLRVLKDYPPPKASRSSKSSNGEPNGASRVQVNGNSSVSPDLSLRTPFTAPFLKAPSHTCEAPYEYVNSLPSKGMRNRLIDALNVWLKVPSKSLETIKNIVQMLHNASLMLDDIEDHSRLRRGEPVTSTFYGASQTINSANFTYVKAVQATMELQTAMKCMDIFIDELTNLHCGQSLDLYWRHHARCPTVDEYIMMVDNKTGGLFRLLLRLMEAESSSKQSNLKGVSSNQSPLERLLVLTGRYYQIRDDYLNLTSADYESKKGYLEDLDEGKFSLPLIHLLQKAPLEDRDRIMSTVYNRHPGTTGLDREVKRHILNAMKTADTFGYVRGVLKDLHAEIMNAFDEVESSMGKNNSARLLFFALAV